MSKKQEGIDDPGKPWSVYVRRGCLLGLHLF
jgi:hypothetical protein